MSRWRLEVVAWQGDSAAVLQGHLSSRRKDSHLAIVAEEDVESGLAQRAWERWTLPHVALPEGRPEDMDLSTQLLGKTLAAPLMIAGMTGGSPRAGEVNQRLARTAQELGLAMGLGSQRVLLEQEGLAQTFQVREVAPDILLLANVGAIQLSLGVSVDDCRRLVDVAGADALALHLNPIQEMVQPEGDRDWRALRPRIEELIATVGVPVVIKEVGFGISADMAVLARDMGAAAIDVGGGGGTSWARIEGLRAEDSERQAMGETFRRWGISTGEAVAECRAALGPDFPIIATGGVRNGVDVARALALGADLAGMALPFFRAADDSEASAGALARRILEELRIAMLCSGAGGLAGLRDLQLRESK
jgi:isopentenyl-diphosphate delta-isomerase